MSMLNLKTKSEILEFFKILAEESVKEARDKVLDPGVESFLEKSRRDKKTYSSITEEEEGEEVEVEEEEFPPGAGASQPQDMSMPEPPQPAPDSDIEQVSLDSIRDKIKSMRSGLSVDDSAVQNPMRTYFDLLNDPERKALYAFLDALAAIMTGAATGETASDPSDPPYNVQMTSGGEEESVEAEEEVSEELPAEEEPAEEVPEEDDVPIRVGSVQESASINKIRNRVRELLKKS